MRIFHTHDITDDAKVITIDRNTHILYSDVNPLQMSVSVLLVALVGRFPAWSRGAASGIFQVDDF